MKTAQGFTRVFELQGNTLHGRKSGGAEGSAVPRTFTGNTASHTLSSPWPPSGRRVGPNSELELRPKLQGARIVGRGDLSEVQIPGVLIDVVELRVVEDVEILEPQFQFRHLS
jgi:hypothetical protein